MAQEMGLAFEIVPTAFPTDAEYRRINPLGTLPALVDGDVKIFESVAIVDYLARRYGPTPLAPEPGEAGFGDYLQFLHMGEATLAGPLTYLLHARFFGPKEAQDNWSLGDIRKTFASRLRLVAQRLDSAPYMAGDRFTAADISVGYALFMARAIKAIESYDDRCTEYLTRLLARPACPEAMRTA
jgi:glutathione S-transferase